MYTILILGKETAESFHRHLPVFDEMLNRNELGICLWNEEGKSLEDALPDLHRLTDDKREWRAMVVRYEDDRVLASLKTAEDNPYDFEETDVDRNPLLRLANQLSRPVETFRKYSSSQTVPSFDGILPSSVVFVGVRNAEALRTVTNGTQILTEPDFADRNGYPSGCRFAIVDRYLQGPVRKEADDFLFWNIVLILAVNSSSLLQAYRLHQIDLVPDKKQLSSLLNGKLAELHQIRMNLSRMLEYQSVHLNPESASLPDFTVNAERIRYIREQGKTSVSTEPFLRIPDDPDEQLRLWNQESEEVVSNLLRDWKALPGKIQSLTSSLQYRSGFSEEDVQMLSSTGMQNLETELQRLRMKTIDQNSRLQKIRDLPTEKLEELSDTTRSLIHSRVRRKTSIRIPLGLSIVSMLPMLPAWIYGIQNLSSQLLILSVVTVLPALSPWIVMRYAQNQERDRVIRSISAWNEEARKQEDRLGQYAEQYLEYESDFLSCRRASSYLEAARTKQAESEQIQDHLEDLLTTVTSCEDQIKKWITSLGLKLENLTVSIKDYELEDYLEETFESHVFSLQDSGLLETRAVEGNGRIILTPLPFIDSLRIIPLERIQLK